MLRWVEGLLQTVEMPPRLTPPERKRRGLAQGGTRAVWSETRPFRSLENTREVGRARGAFIVFDLLRSCRARLRRCVAVFFATLVAARRFSRGAAFAGDFTGGGTTER